MGKYSFGYAIPENNKRQQSFCYDKKSAEEYYFTYDRDRHSDTSKFNDLVPVTKNRARSFYLNQGKWAADTNGFGQLSDNKWLNEKNRESSVVNSAISLDTRVKKALKQNVISISQRGILINASVWSQLIINDKPKKTNVNHNIQLHQDIFQGIYNKNLMLTKQDNKSWIEMNQNIIPLYKQREQKIIVSKKLLGAATRRREAICNNNLFMNKPWKFDGNIFDTISGKNKKRRVVLNPDVAWAKHRHEKELNIFPLVLLNRLSRKLFNNQTEDMLKRPDREGFIKKNVIFGNITKKSIEIINSIPFLSLSIRKAMTMLKNILLKPTNKELVILDQLMPPVKIDSNTTSIIKSGAFAASTKKGFSNHDSGMFNKKDNLPIKEWQSIFGLTKDDFNMTVVEYKDGGKKEYKNGAKLYGFNSGMKSNLSMSKLDYGVFNSKLNVGVITDFDLFAIKERIPMRFIMSEVNSDSEGFLLPLVKSGLSSVKEQQFSFGIPNKKSFNIFEDVMTSKSPVVGNIIPSLTDGIHKKSFQSFIDYKNEVLKKYHVNGTLNTNNFVNKNQKRGTEFNSGCFIDKDRKLLRLSNKEFQVLKESKNSYLSKQIFIDKNGKEIDFQKLLYFINKENHSMINPQKLPTFNRNKSGIDILRQKWVTNHSKEIFETKETVIVKAADGVHVYDNYTDHPMAKELWDTEIKESLVLSKETFHNSYIVKSIQEFKKTLKELDVREDNNVTWAWVYEHPDPFENQWIGIDELLIPENDTRYECFEDVIFDKKKMIPKNPVKQLDDNTWIAKYPIKHPLPECQDIGIEYIDIETGLMKRIFLEFYRIWQKNVFKFGGMDMAKSTGLMLEYLYAWIMTYVPDEYQEQALRVLKMIRWYGEASIIQNSQYIVTYELEDLKSNLHTGECDIPYLKHNMVISKEDAVFMPEQINEDSWVEFYARNTKETTISFSIISTVGTVFIYINNKLVDTITGTARNLTYKLEYVYPQNVIRIEKPKDHNRNKEFFVGYVTIKDGAAGHLKMEYDPKLKAGNKPLDEIAQKMIAYANLYENNQEVLDMLRKGNLGVSETYKRLQEYWDLHHNDKLKGKRLTIKEV